MLAAVRSTSVSGVNFGIATRVFSKESDREGG
jgi:hypothetical protein